MLLETVSLDWVQDHRFELNDRNGYTVIMDQPDGVNASDLLPLSLIGCSSYDVIAILQKQRQDVVDLSVSAQSTRDPDPPWRFRKIHIQYKLSGRALDPDKVRRAIHLAEEKYCGVYATLKDALEISNDFEIIEV
ncbi:MAG TPA: OsmC family protein [Anaerolineales bacterium]|nr:OsmC family protein [Anaerolineales bacterium]